MGGKGNQWKGFTGSAGQREKQTVKGRSDLKERVGRYNLED